jgi:hypothetical protein
MRSVCRNRMVLVALALTAGACVETPDPSPSLTSPSAGAQMPAGEGSVGAAGNPPAGAFRTTPVANEDVVTIPVGEVVLVNGARFVAADPGDELKVEIEWGDGERAAIGCGPCRLSHVYPRPGTYSLRATIHNRRTDRGEATQTFRVVVQSPQGPDLGPPPRFCHPIHAFSGPRGSETRATCPSGATEFCDAVPIVATSSAQARLACDTCLGLRCDNGIFGGGVWYWRRPDNGYVFFQYGPDPLFGTEAGNLTSGEPAIAGRWAP